VCCVERKRLKSAADSIIVSRWSKVDISITKRRRHRCIGCAAKLQRLRTTAIAWHAAAAAAAAATAELWRKNCGWFRLNIELTAFIPLTHVRDTIIVTARCSASQRPRLRQHRAQLTTRECGRNSERVLFSELTNTSTFKTSKIFCKFSFN